MKIKIKREIWKQGKQRIEMVKPNKNRTSTENKNFKEYKTWLKSYARIACLNIKKNKNKIKPFFI